MQRLFYMGRVFYMIAMGAIGIQQLYYGNLVSFIGPTWPTPFLGNTIMVYLFSCYLIILAIATLMGFKVSKYLFALGCILLAIDIVSQVPYLYFVFPYKKTHLGVWEPVLKELALAGGAFIAARMCNNGMANKSQPIMCDGLAFAGSLFFAVTMICFGCAHYLYADATTTLVPGWIPWAHFWVYFTGTALIAGGLSIVFRAMTFIGAFLLGSMIFIWFWIIHVPSAIYHGLDSQGNEFSAGLSALAFSGIAYMIAGLYAANSTHSNNVN
jgi:uncharacterized membrane protein